MKKEYTVDTRLDVFRPDVTAEMLLDAIKRLKSESPLATISICNAFVDSGKKFNVDQVYLLSHAILESAWGTSRFATDRNNLYGYKAYDSNPDNAAAFKTKEACIAFIAEFVSNYYLKSTGKWYGGSATLRGMNVRYATAGHWADSIAKLCNLVEGSLVYSDVQVTVTTPDLSLKVYPSTRNVQVVPENGANVRTSPNTKTRNITSSIVKDTMVPVSGFVIGEDLNGNNLWWVLVTGGYMWSGATNVTPTVPSSDEGIGDKPVIEKTKEELVEELRVAGENIKTVAANSAEKDTTILSLQTSLNEKISEIARLKVDSNNVIAIKTTNESLSHENELWKEKVGDLKKDLQLAYIKAFEKWELIEVPSGAMAIAKLPVIAFRIYLLIKSAMQNGCVIGWKIGGKLVKVEKEEPQVDTKVSDIINSASGQ